MELSPHGWMSAMLRGALIFPGSIAAYGQAGRGTLTGRVRAGAAPLPGASVQLEGTSYGGVTGADGRFALGNLPAAAYTLTVTRVGFTPHKQTVAVAAGVNADVDHPDRKRAEPAGSGDRGPPRNDV